MRAIATSHCLPSIQNDESAQAVEAATFASSPRHHIYSAYHFSSLCFCYQPMIRVRRGPLGRTRRFGYTVDDLASWQSFIS
ncbi:hypothetical protein Y032_0131g1580 [Ancylostoma ceylanicum]|uniref:Uncharacterized protein n=1 Tax=Ancylostoma ceylanicum TaxID=53326 RepID=A0A016T6Y6_9BILA|nr:hypothetical protein Y032_0131g1580 [Ancylostoma ceylanicum]